MSAIVREIFAKRGAPPVAKLFLGEQNLSALLSIFENRGVGRRVAPSTWADKKFSDCYYIVEKHTPGQDAEHSTVMVRKHWRGQDLDEKLKRVGLSKKRKWYLVDFAKPKCLE
ncbi:hypothetical protein IWQ61_007845 [Dispira simplex]|nr:hypothetical protein IWQ61_007845 [Dispira simplex]